MTPPIHLRTNRIRVRFIPCIPILPEQIHAVQTHAPTGPDHTLGLCLTLSQMHPQMLEHLNVTPALHPFQRVIPLLDFEIYLFKT